jgi:hypothetical protein
MNLTRVVFPGDFHLRSGPIAGCHYGTRISSAAYLCQAGHCTTGCKITSSKISMARMYVSVLIEL